MKKFIYLGIMFIFIMVILNYKIEASTKLDGIENFPSTYQPYLNELAKKHPNWKFKALYTNLDWNYVISQEAVFGKNLVPKNYSDSWKNTTPGQYNVEVDSGWVDSSRQAVEYCMDPRNFLNEVRIFQFEALSYEARTNNLDGIEKTLYGTEFYNTKVSYLDSYGNTISMSEKYSDLILRGGRTSRVSPYHLASRIKQEVGPFLSHSSISGNVEGYKGLYNFYNIGATSSSEPMGAIKKGLQYAKDGNGASAQTKNKYLIPWNNKEKSITGGGIFIGSSYINVGQNTIYLQKFDVNDDRNGNLFTHQYMTNVLAPYSESKSIYSGYQKSGLINTAMTFIIPVYNNMPSIPTQSPSINSNDFLKDNTRVYCNATNVNIRTGPSTSYEVITQVSIPTQMTRIAKGNQSGEKWDKVQLENGIIGYISQNYVNIAKEIDESKINFDSSLTINGLEISGIKYENNTVADLRKLIITDYEIEILNYNNVPLQSNDIIGTGCKIRVKDKGEILRQYQVILYGDCDGDGIINSVDLLVLQRHLLQIKQLDSIFVKASNINKDGKKPTSVDLLLIQRHILGLQTIVQEGNVQLANLEEELETENTKLENLAIENTLLYPPFDENETNYKAEVSKDTVDAKILAVPQVEKAKVQIIGNNNLKTGKNIVTIIVTAQDGISKKRYQIELYRRNEQEEEAYLQDQQEQRLKLESAYSVQKLSATSKANKMDSEQKATDFVWIVIVAGATIAIISGLNLYKRKK